MYSAIRLFTVLYLSARLLRSSALCYGLPSSHDCLLRGRGWFWEEASYLKRYIWKSRWPPFYGKTRYISTISRKNRGLWTVYSGIHFLNNWGLVYICYHYRSWYSTSENILLYQWCLPRFFLVSRNLGVSYSSSANLSCLIPFLSF